MTINAEELKKTLDELLLSIARTPEGNERNALITRRNTLVNIYDCSEETNKETNKKTPENTVNENITITKPLITSSSSSVSAWIYIDGKYRNICIDLLNNKKYVDGKETL